MCHCAENRRLLLAALGGASPVATLARVGANMGEDARDLAARAAAVARAQAVAARKRLAR